MASDHALQMCCPIVELRQYTLHPGQRDTLIELFEREFIEPQEAAGMTVIGQFRDVDDPNRFVWLRGFPDMSARKASLQTFYGGPVWQKHRNAANATMVDSDNVLLLRPARPMSGFHIDATQRPSRDKAAAHPGLVVATILPFVEPPAASFLEEFERVLAPALSQSGASILSYFVTEKSVNTFPMLPVREEEQVFIWFSRFRDQTAYDECAAALARAPEWREQWEAVVRHLKSPPEILKLTPTFRSVVRA